MRSVALEEHLILPGAEALVPAYRDRRDFAEVRDRLAEVGQERLRAMDEGGIELSVLSVTSPGLQGLGDAGRAAEVARVWNDALGEVIDSHPDRFRGFAALPMAEPDGAATELRRAVRDLGFVGGLINGFDDAGGGEPRYYDESDYLGFWREAVDLDVPVYLHPRSAPRGRVTTYAGYPELSGPPWGFHVETAEHVLRLMLGGVFDAVPELQLIVGHLGEILPFLAWRIDHMLEMDRRGTSPQPHPVELSVTEYLRRNVLVTTSGFFDAASLRHALDVLGSDRLMYAVDYPYESTTLAREWLDGLDLSPATRAAIAYGNARRVLKLG